MFYKAFIEWSKPFECDILRLAKSKNKFLKLEQCIYMYLCRNNHLLKEGSLTKPIYIACLTCNIFISTIKSKLIWSFANNDLRDLFKGCSKKCLTIMIGKVSTEDVTPVSDHTLKAVYNSLVKEMQPLRFEEMGYNGIRSNIEVIHLLNRKQNEQLRTILTQTHTSNGIPMPHENVK